MLEFMSDNSGILYAQRGVYKEGTPPNNYDKNIWQYDPINLTSLAINPSVSSPTISYLLGEIKRGTDGNYYIPNLGKKMDKIHSYSGTAWNSNLVVSDTTYQIASSLPTQVYKIYDQSATDLIEHTRTVGEKEYELKDHLGNVKVTISDIKQIVSVGTNSAIVDASDEFVPEVLSYRDYYPFGMEMVGRKYTANEAYRYGFNGKENDGETMTQDYGMRIYDGRIGKFLSVDPLWREYPYKSSYDFAENTPIIGADLDGAELDLKIISVNDGKVLIEVCTAGTEKARTREAVMTYMQQSPSQELSLANEDITMPATMIIAEDEDGNATASYIYFNKDGDVKKINFNAYEVSKIAENYEKIEGDDNERAQAAGNFVGKMKVGTQSVNTVRSRTGKYTEPTLPEKTIVNEDGVRVEHYYKSGDHDPPHMHVKGKGPETKIGANGKPIAGSPKLTLKQENVVNLFKSKIRTAGNKIKEYQNYIKNRKDK